MTKHFFKTFCGVIVLMLVSATMGIAQTKDKALARVNKDNGVYVFTDCEPVSKYEILDRTKVHISWSGQYNEVRDKLVKKTLKDYPKCEAIVCENPAIVMKYDESVSDSDKPLARVRKINGLFVFTDCEPVNDYDIVERESATFGFKADYGSIRNKLIKKAIKDYPDADGVILQFTTGGTDRAVVIKFK